MDLIPLSYPHFFYYSLLAHVLFFIILICFYHFIIFPVLFFILRLLLHIFGHGEGSEFFARPVPDLEARYQAFEFLVRPVPNLEESYEDHVFSRYQDFRFLVRPVTNLDESYEEFEFSTRSIPDLEAIYQELEDFYQDIEDFESSARFVPDLEALEGPINEVDTSLLETQGTVVNSDVCVICLGEFRKGEACRVLTSCEHMFHPKCINRWLRWNPTCPSCRNSTYLDTNMVICYGNDHV